MWAEQPPHTQELGQAHPLHLLPALHLLHTSPSAARTPRLLPAPRLGMERGPKAAAALSLAPATLGHSTQFTGQLQSHRVRSGDLCALLCVPRLGLGSLLPVLGRDIGKRLEVRRKVDACLGKANYISRLEHAQARLTLSYNRRGDLAIHLVSPMGTRSTLLAARYLLGWGGPRVGPGLGWHMWVCRAPAPTSCPLSPRPHDFSADGFNDWAFMTTHSWDEDPSGEWVLEIENTSDANNYGRARPASPPCCLPQPSTGAGTVQAPGVLWCPWAEGNAGSSGALQ